MPGPVLVCPNCQAPWPDDPTAAHALSVCPSCGRKGTVAVFPALHRKSAHGHAGEIILVEGEAACFYHHEKRAVQPCDACGRFLCALCCIVVNKTNVCPSCFEAGQKKGTLDGVAGRRTLYDSAALSLALLPLLTCGLAIPLSAPAAIWIAIYGWKRTASVLPRSRIRAVIALVLGIVEIALLAAAIVAYYHSRNSP
jgi:hypothetical protein